MNKLETAIPDRVLHVIVISVGLLAVFIALIILANRLYHKSQPESSALS